MMEYQNNYTTQNDGAFGWEDEIQRESSFVPLPEGDYRFTIEKFDRARYNGGDKVPACNKAVVTFRIDAPDGSSMTLVENFLLHQKMEWKLSEFFASVGMKQKEERVRMQWTPQLIGKQGVCRIVINNYKDKDGNERSNNRIEKLYPSYDQPVLAPPVQPSAQYQQAATSAWKRGAF